MDFYDVVRSNTYLILNIESTGLGPRAEVSEIAIINAAGETLLNTPVSPKCETAGTSDQAHKYWPEVQQQLIALVQGKHIILHDEIFQIRLLKQSAAAWGHVFKRDFYSYCALQEYAAAHGEWSNDIHGYLGETLRRAAYQLGADCNGKGALANCHMLLAVCKGLLAEGADTAGPRELENDLTQDQENALLIAEILGGIAKTFAIQSIFEQLQQVSKGE